jgi:hypothetical protein
MDAGFSVHQFPGGAQFRAVIRVAAMELAQGFAKSHALDVSCQDNLKYSLLESYRPTPSSSERTAVMQISDSTAYAVQIRRIYSEYIEMPGLRLTCVQAQRLWGLDADTCVKALRVLVDAGFLRLTNAGQYVRLTEESATMPPLRMAKAELNRSPGVRARVN